MPQPIPRPPLRDVYSSWSESSQSSQCPLFTLSLFFAGALASFATMSGCVMHDAEFYFSSLPSTLYWHIWKWRLRIDVYLLLFVRRYPLCKLLCVFCCNFLCFLFGIKTRTHEQGCFRDT